MNIRSIWINKFEAGLDCRAKPLYMQKTNTIITHIITASILETHALQSQ